VTGIEKSIMIQNSKALYNVGLAWLASDIPTTAMSVRLNVGSQEVVHWIVSKNGNNIKLFVCFINYQALMTHGGVEL
jgi:hypothetical protein